MATAMRHATKASQVRRPALVRWVCLATLKRLECCCCRDNDPETWHYRSRIARGPPSLKNVKPPKPAARTINAIKVVAVVSAIKIHSARRRSTATAAATNAIAATEMYRAKETRVSPGSMLMLPASGRPSAAAALSQIGLADPDSLQRQHLNQHPNGRNDGDDGHWANDSCQETGLARPNTQGDYCNRHGSRRCDRAVDDRSIKDDERRRCNNQQYEEEGRGKHFGGCADGRLGAIVSMHGCRWSYKAPSPRHQKRPE